MDCSVAGFKYAGPPVRDMRRVAACLVLVALLSAPVLGVTVPDDEQNRTAKEFDVGGPAWMEPYGPRGERTDNVYAAAFTAIVVAAVIYRGLKVSDDTDY